MDGVDGAEWLYAIMTDLACTDRELDAAVALLTGDDPTPRREIGITWLERLGYLTRDADAPRVVDRGDGWRERVRTWELRMPAAPQAVRE